MFLCKKFLLWLTSLFCCSLRSIAGSILSSIFFFALGSTNTGGLPRTSYDHCISAVVMTSTPTSFLPYSSGVNETTSCWPALPARGRMPREGVTEKTDGESAVKFALNSASASKALASEKETDAVRLSVDSSRITSSTSGAPACRITSNFHRPPPSWRTTSEACAFIGRSGVHCTAMGNNRSSLGGPATCMRIDAPVTSRAHSSGTPCSSTAKPPLGPCSSSPSNGSSRMVCSCCRALIASESGFIDGLVSAYATIE
mmetsp:Transcript_15747/g.40121  ORF Transcript_15747/g.40121 Transcript_15747/m.40121 type:complete len:257 (+) Transcript_15747:161-931(+)